MPPCHSAPRAGRSSRTRRLLELSSGVERILRRGGAWRTAKRTASALQALDRLLQRLVVRARLERLLPDAVRLVTLAHHPQHLAEVRADLGVGPADVGAAQLLGGALQVAFAIQHPAHAVDDEVVVGREL